MPRTLHFALVAILCLTSASSIAATFPIQLTDFTGSESLIDFEDLTETPPTGPIKIGPVTISESSSSGGSLVPGWRLVSKDPAGFDPDGNFLGDNGAVSDFTIDFSTPMFRVGLIVGIGFAGYEVEFLDINLVRLGTVSSGLQDTNSSFFAGWENSEGIIRIHVFEGGPENDLIGGIDDIRYEATAVPMPAGLWLLSSGLVFLASLRSRR